MIDIIVNDEKLKKKLIFTNTKNAKNGHYYQRVVDEVTQRSKERNEDFKFTVKQTRTRFKRCIKICKDAALKMKTASGIARFQEKMGAGKWFNDLLPYVRSMDSSQPEQVIEPSATATASADASPDFEVERTEGPQTPIEPAKKKAKFVPTPPTGSKRGTTTTLISTITKVLDAIKENPTDKLLELYKEEAKEQRKNDQQFLSLMTRMVEAQERSAPATDNNSEIAKNQRNSNVPPTQESSQARHTFHVPPPSDDDYQPSVPYQYTYGQSYAPQYTYYDLDQAQPTSSRYGMSNRHVQPKQ